MDLFSSALIRQFYYYLMFVNIISAVYFFFFTMSVNKLFSFYGCFMFLFFRVEPHVMRGGRVVIYYFYFLELFLWFNG